MKTLNIFRSGRHTTSAGQLLEFTEDDLIATAEGYNPALHEAPIVIGHPTTNAPAFGWVESLNFADSSLTAVPRQVNQEFEELVKSGAYKKISASFYSPDAPANPAPGTYYLRHVGFLGAQPPSVKGLAPIEFNENEEGIISFEDVPMKSWQMRDIKNIFRNLREWIIGEKGKDVADGIIPDHMINDLEPAQPDKTNFNEEENMSPEELKKKEKALADERMEFEQEKAEFTETQKKKAIDPNPDKPSGDERDEAANVKFAEQDKKIATLTAQLARKEHAEFVESLAKEGKILPREKAGLIDFMGTLSDEDSIEFAEDGQTVKGSSLAVYKNQLASRPPVVNFEELSKNDGHATATDAKDIADQAVAFKEDKAKQGITISTTAAVAHVTRSK